MLLFFWRCDPFIKLFIKLKLLCNFCCDFYGSCLWDLSHSSIADLSTAWRKDLRRLWGLPYSTHRVLLAPLCGMLPLEYELMCRSVNFMNKCLASCNEVVSFFSQKWYICSEDGFSWPSAQWCCDTVGISFFNIHSISKDFVFVMYMVLYLIGS